MQCVKVLILIYYSGHNVSYYSKFYILLSAFEYYFQYNVNIIYKCIPNAYFISFREKISNQ